MPQTLITVTKLLVVGEIQEDANGAAIRFEPGTHGRSALCNANHASQLRLARRSQERKHPVGVTFGEGPAIMDLVRADNDLPRELWQDDPGHVSVLFQGHDGVFRIKSDHPEFTRIHAVLVDAIRRKARVWFIAQKPGLELLDVLISSEVANGKPR